MVANSSGSEMGGSPADRRIEFSMVQSHSGGSPGPVVTEAYQAGSVLVVGYEYALGHEKQTGAEVAASDGTPVLAGRVVDEGT